MLRGIEIYGITQDLDRNIWLTTSNGVYKYDGLNFKNYKNEQLGGNDFFQPTIAKSGRLYFTTITGNIYTFRNEEIVLFKKNDVPNAKEYTSMVCSENYIYTISNDSLYQIDSLANRTCIFGYENAFARFQYKNYKDHQRMTFYTTGLRDKITVEGSKVNIQSNKQHAFETELSNTESLILINGSPRFYTRKVDNDFFHYKADINGNFKPAKEKDNIAIWYNCSNNNKWVIKAFEEGLEFTGAGAKKTQSIFSDYIINYIFEDSEGNIWIGTQNNGLILISNVNNFLLTTDEPVKGLESSYNSIFSISSNKTYILDPITNIVSTIPNINALSNVYLIADKRRPNSFIVQNSTGLQHYKNFELNNNFEISSSLIKRHHWYKDSLIILSSINGAHLFDPSMAATNQRIGPLYNRCIDAIWVENTKEYFVASSKGLVACHQNGSINKYIKYNNVPLDIQLLFEYETSVFAISTSGKIYKINSNTYATDFIAELDKNFLVGGIIKDANIYLIDKQKLFVFNCERNQLSELPLQLSPNMQLSGGVLYNDVLWLGSNRGFIHYSLNQQNDKSSAPNLFIEVVNNKIPIKSQQRIFNYLENHFIFKIRNRDFKHHGLSKIHYQLVGSDKTTALVSSIKGDIEYKSLSPGRYTFKAQIINPAGFSSDWKEFSFEITPPYWQTWWFYLLAVLVLITVFSIFTSYRQRTKNIKRELERRLIESELTAIKAQMNPHFIFNCLNSIQDLILKQDVRASNRYLGLFSDLVRKTMEDSSKESVVLSRELNLLKLYLDLEKLRFKDLNYSIIYSFSEDELEQNSIPPMLIQPFLENALKHGLLHHIGDKNLEVQIVRNKDDLIFQIKDNGVGLKEGMKIKKRQSKYRSFSGDAISKRIDLINTEAIFKIDFEIFDFSQNPDNKWTTIVEVRFRKYFTP